MGTGTLGCLVAVPVKSLDQDPQALTPAAPRSQQGLSSWCPSRWSQTPRPRASPAGSSSWAKALQPAESSLGAAWSSERRRLVAGTSGFYPGTRHPGVAPALARLLPRRCGSRIDPTADAS